MIYILLMSIIFWFVCGYFSAGYYCAFFWREFPALQGGVRLAELKNDFYISILIGPLGLIAARCAFPFDHGRLYPWNIKLGGKQ